MAGVDLRTDYSAAELHRLATTTENANHERTVGKLLKTLGFSHISARPRHPRQDERTIEAFKKTGPRP